MRSAFELRADQFDNNKRHLCIIKQNYLPDNVKSKSFVLNLKEDLTFEFTGERTDLAFLAQTNQRVASDEDLVAQVLKLKHQGLSSRSIEKSLEEQGIIICKTKICEIIKKNAGNIIVPVHQAPIVNFNDYQLGDESLN